MRWPEQGFHSSKCICPTSTPAKVSGTDRTSPTSRSEPFADSGAKVTTSRLPTRCRAARSRAMDLRKLKKLIDLVEESGIAELEITEGEEKVKFVKSGAASPLPAAPLPVPAAAATPAGTPPPVLPGGSAEPATAVQEGH